MHMMVLWQVDPEGWVVGASGMIDVSESIRCQLVVLARRPRARLVPRNREMPCRWRPAQVIEPATGMPFTESGAWHFVADAIEQRLPIRVIPLVKPPGSIGYVILITLQPDAPRLYVKLQLTGDKILGRRFHYSDFSDSEGR